MQTIQRGNTVRCVDARTDDPEDIVVYRKGDVGEVLAVQEAAGPRAELDGRLFDVKMSYGHIVRGVSEKRWERVESARSGRARAPTERQLQRLEKDAGDLAAVVLWQEREREALQERIQHNRRLLNDLNDRIEEGGGARQKADPDDFRNRAERAMRRKSWTIALR